jgi:hypothetical protein
LDDLPELARVGGRAATGPCLRPWFRAIIAVTGKESP